MVPLEVSPLSLDVIKWLSLVLLMATWIVVHYTLVMRTARMPGLTPIQRVMTIAIPLLTPFFGFRQGAKRRAVLWWVLFIAYFAVRVFG